MNKLELRRKYKLIRDSVVDKEAKNELIKNKVLLDENFINSKVIAIYVSYKNEVDTINIINECFKLNKVVCVPVVLNDHNMFFCKINSLSDLKVKNSLNILEPSNIDNNIVNIEDIDLFIMPGICFDKNKNRVGYGGGYYDRYLSKASDKYKIGLAFFEQIITDDYIRCDETDIKLDEIITDKVLIK